MTLEIDSYSKFTQRSIKDIIIKRESLEKRDIWKRFGYLNKLTKNPIDEEAYLNKYNSVLLLLSEPVSPFFVITMSIRSGFHVYVKMKILYHHKIIISFIFRKINS